MQDYRGKLCVLDGEYLARCVGQNFYTEELTFEVEPDGPTFERQGSYGVEVYEDGELTFNDVKHLLPRVKRSND